MEHVASPRVPGDADEGVVVPTSIGRAICREVSVVSFCWLHPCELRIAASAASCPWHGPGEAPSQEAGSVANRLTAAANGDSGGGGGGSGGGGGGGGDSPTQTIKVSPLARAAAAKHTAAAALRRAEEVACLGLGIFYLG